MKISIIIPILNEREIISDSLFKLESALNKVQENFLSDWEVIVVDAGSSDGSDIVGRDMAHKNHWTFMSQKIKSSSIGKTVNVGLTEMTGDVALLMPCDVSPSCEALQRLWAILIDPRVTCGGFVKQYAPYHWLLKLYAKLQNEIRLKFLRHLVWTNGIFFRRSIVLERPIPTGGFLEDVIFSDFLRHQSGWAVIDEPISVSARRYYQDRILKRIFVNGLIMLLYRLGLGKPESLKKLYLSTR